MDNLRYIEAALLYIEENLSDELLPESISGRHFVSQRKFYRDFYARTGHSVKEYIRKRRISNACEKLKCSQLPLAVIANHSGCKTQQVFHKQFRSIVGMTPLEYRQGNTYFHYYPLSLEGICHAVSIGSETIPACYITRFYDDDSKGIEDRAVASLGEIHGRVFGRGGKRIGGRFCYETMTECAGASKTDLFATCVVGYDEVQINSAWNYLYNSWLSASMFEEAGGGYFEEFLMKNGKPHRLKLYVPVRKRKTAQHISMAQRNETAFLVARKSGNNAEQMAAEAVINYLKKNNPQVIKTAERFYVCEHGGEYICGIECGGDFPATQSSDFGVEILHLPEGVYANLPEDCAGDIRAGVEKMEAWLKNNAVAHLGEPVFALYEKQRGAAMGESIRMTLCKRLA